MEEANVHGTGHPSSAAPDASPDPALPSSSESCQAQQQQVHQLDETREPGSSYEASEIASHFINPKASINTEASIDSVKGAVSKFGVGGVLDWREKRKHVQDELDMVQGEVTEYQKRAQEAEAGRAQALRELGAAVTAADELWLGLERARAEQAQTRQQAELRLDELRRAASERAAAKAKAEIDAARDRRAAALADLQAAGVEVESLEKVRARAAAEAGAAVARARESAAASREAGKAVEDLAAELVALKGELESSHAAHVEAEAKRMGLAVAWEEDKARWQIELEEGEQEAKRLREEPMAACEVEMKVETASKLMASLEAELFARAVEGTLGQEEKPAAIGTQSVLEKTKKELDDVKASVERAKDEAKCLRVAAASMRDELEKEKAELTALRRKEREREGLSSSSIPYLEEELRWVTAELAEAEARPKTGGDESKMEQVGEARREAEEAKAKARSAREEVARAREDAGVAKAAVATMEARLEAVTREILAANTSEEIATASAGALLQESKPPKKAESDKAVEGGVSVTLTVEEYDELSRRAQETEEAAGMRVVEAVKLIQEAKDAEVKKREKVARLDKQTELRRQALEAATLEAEEAEFEKLSAERELRQWRAEHEQRRAPGDTGSPRPGLAEISVLDDPGAGEGRGNPHILSPRGGYMPRTELMLGSAADADADARQRKTFFPRIVMFLARKRAQTWK